MTAGCILLLSYSDAQRCFREKKIREFRKNRIVFLGDSRMRDLFMQFDALVRLGKALPWNYGDYFFHDSFESLNNTDIVSVDTSSCYIEM